MFSRIRPLWAGLHAVTLVVTPAVTLALALATPALMLVLAGAPAAAQDVTVERRPLPPMETKLHSDDYPTAARRQGIQGRVLVQFNISDKGRANDFKILDSEPQGVFDDAVKSAMRSIKFTVPKDWGDTGGDKENYTLSYVFKLSPCPTEGCVAPKRHDNVDDWLMLSVSPK